MLYKCDHCDYSSKRLFDLRRHENKKKPCYKKIEVVACKIEETQKVSSEPQIVSSEPQIVSAEPQIVSAEPQIVSAEPQIVSAEPQIVSEFACSKCNKIFNRKDNLRRHEKTCEGLNPLQCPICLKVFATRHGKWKHKMYVKCSPPSSQTNLTTNNNTNIDNSINNSHIDNSVNITNNNTININFRGNFDKITNEDVKRIIDQLEKSDYIKLINENMKSGKYAVPRTIEQIYFNDDFPSMQTLKKERRNDKMVEVHVDGKWEKRMVDDILHKLMGKVEAYHNEYFKHLQDKYKDVPIGSAQWNRLVRPIKNFGHMMLWYEGFKGQEIEKIGIELNSPDDEKERKKKKRDMSKLINEKVYDQTLLERKDKALSIES